MADIRIKDLARTVTDPTSSEYVETDHATDGSGKLDLAAWLAARRNALAPRQALVFHGTAGASIANLPAFGTAHFTLAFWLRPAVLPNYSTLIKGTTGGFYVYYGANGALTIQKEGGATVLTTAAGTIVVGETHLWTICRTGGTTTLRKDGVTVASASDANDYTAADIYLCSTGGGEFVNGWVCPLIYNFALSAAEVLALLNEGAPVAADYRSSAQPFGSSIVTGNNSTFAGAGGWYGAGITIGGGQMTVAAGYAILATGMVPEKRYRLVFDVVSNPTTIVVDNGGTAVYSAAVSGTGTKTVEFIAVGSDALELYPTGGTLVIDNVLLYPIGLLCAPEATAPGNGYQWRDTSGNLADITLPTSGVAWALPDTRPNRVRGVGTWAGTHEPKSLLGQRAFPPGAVRTLLTLKSTAATAGAGCKVGSTNDNTRWKAAGALAANTKIVATLANQLPAGTADADNDLIADPDDANFTGSITAEAHYVITEGA